MKIQSVIVFKQLATPGDLDTDPGKRAEKLLQKTVKWTEEIYNWTEQEIYEYLHQPDKSGIVYIEYSYQQIGLTQEWYRNISAKIGNAITVRREILLQRLRGSSASPYDRDDIERLIDIAKRPIDTIMLHKYYRLDIYERLNRSITYLVGIDCAITIQYLSLLLYEHAGIVITKFPLVNATAVLITNLSHNLHTFLQAIFFTSLNNKRVD